MKQRNEEAQADEQTLRISLDAKAAVKVGPFARGGKSRVRTSAADHDFEAIATVTPVGIFLPTSDELFLYGVTSKVTSDCLVDRLGDWWETVKERFPRVKTLLINLDNGPESHSRRTQFMQRLVEFARQYHLTLPGGRDPICYLHDLERNTSHGHFGDHHLSERSQTHQRSYAGGRNPTSAFTISGQVVHRHWGSLTSHPG